MKVLVIPAQSCEPLRIQDIPDTGNAQSDAIHDILGGWLEVAPQPHPEVTIWCDEEGKLKGKSINARASELWEMIWGETLDDVLVGDIILTGGTDSEGEILPVPESVIRAVSTT